MTWTTGWLDGVYHRDAHPGRVGGQLEALLGAVLHTTDTLPSAWKPMLDRVCGEAGKGDGAHFWVGRDAAEGVVQTVSILRSANHAGGDHGHLNGSGEAGEPVSPVAVPARRKPSRQALFTGAAVILILGSAELGLRLFGGGLAIELASGNRVLREDAQALKIVAIGESTTADMPSEGLREAWPRQLERKLAEHGVKARVYDLATPATTSSQILMSLPEQLDHFRPQIAVSMMGINDSGTRLVPIHATAFDQLRLVKLYRWARSALAEVEWNWPYHFERLASSKEIVERLKSSDPLSAFGLIDREAREMGARKRALYFRYFAHAVDPDLTSHRRDAEIKLELLRRSLNASLRADTVHILAYLYSERGMDAECLTLAGKVAAAGRTATDRVLTDFAGCAAGSPKKAEWTALLSSLSGGKLDPEFLDRDGVTIRNYRDLHRLLKERGILHIAMQYPTWDVARLQRYFQGGAEFGDVRFVENRVNFSDALAKHPFNDVFVDRFATGFGHCTPYGNSLIADAALGAVLESLTLKKASNP